MTYSRMKFVTCNNMDILESLILKTLSREMSFNMRTDAVIAYRSFLFSVMKYQPCPDSVWCMSSTTSKRIGCPSGLQKVLSY